MDDITHGANSFPNTRSFLLHDTITQVFYCQYHYHVRSDDTHRSVVAFLSALATSEEWRLLTLKPACGAKDLQSDQGTALWRTKARLTPSFWTREAQKN